MNPKEIQQQVLMDALDPIAEQVIKIATDTSELGVPIPGQIITPIRLTPFQVECWKGAIVKGMMDAYNNGFRLASTIFKPSDQIKALKAEALTDLRTAEGKYSKMNQMDRQSGEGNQCRKEYNIAEGKIAAYKKVLTIIAEKG